MKDDEEGQPGALRAFYDRNSGCGREGAVAAYLGISQSERYRLSLEGLDQIFSTLS